ncbi:hypothetical protein R3P38DRAFT_2790970 [Favolaschia claudopus]|uniref:Uncharacterized protein n=1 Tax=Favolaschia claudopus TaxID=2862362 RepID=A0AAW0AII5_9AGAR
MSIPKPKAAKSFHIAPKTQLTSHYTPKTKLTSHCLWRNGDVILVLLQFLSLLDILRFSHIDHNSMCFAKAHLKNRVCRYTAPFFTHVINFLPPLYNSGRNMLFERFFQTLEDTKSWVVGSVALAIASTLSDPPCPNNLNIITYHEHLEMWNTFLIYESGFILKVAGWSDGPYASSAGRYFTFKHHNIPGLSVTLTLSFRPNLGPLFFSAPNTDQMIAIGPYRYIMPGEMEICSCYWARVGFYFVLEWFAQIPDAQTLPTIQGDTVEPQIGKSLCNLTDMILPRTVPPTVTKTLIAYTATFGFRVEIIKEYKTNGATGSFEYFRQTDG